MDTDRWWSTWAPVWDHIEDRHFGTKVTESLIDQIKSDVLIIGAGQGLIIRYLKNKGINAVGLDINPQMVRNAKEKYNIDIVEGDAGDLPFKDNSYATVIISSGVVDYGADEPAIKTFIQEAKRVCRKGGKIFTAFYRVIEPIENIYRKIGVIDQHNTYHMTRIFEINEIGVRHPFRCMSRIREWTGKSRTRVYFEWAGVGLTQPKEFMTERKWINNIFQDGKELGLSRKTLIDSVPDKIPYRAKADVETLLSAIEVSYRDILEFDDCSVVVIENA
jgi:SAM-dependent methyltransferase